MVAVTAHNSIQLTVEEAADLLTLVHDAGKISAEFQSALSASVSASRPGELLTVMVPAASETLKSFVQLADYLPDQQQLPDLLKLLAEHPGLDDALLQTIGMLTQRSDITRFWLDADLSDETSPLTIWIRTDLDRDERHRVGREIHDWWREQFDAFTPYVLLGI